MSTATDLIQAICAIVQAFAAVLASLSIVLGVLKWIWVQQLHNAIKSVGATAVNERKMGYFAVRWWSTLFTRKMIAPPHLPTISTLIKAGDMFSFTSSMIDWIPQVNEEVSWRPLYEAFFRELAWRATTPNNQYPETIRHALDSAYDNVHTVKKSHVSRGISEFTDRHLLYNGIYWRQCLQQCSLDLPLIRDWDKQPLTDPLLGYKRNWEEDLREVWIRDDRPSIQVSREELIALSFILGMHLCLRPDEQSAVPMLYAKGIYGSCIHGEPGPLTEPWKLRLVHWRRDSPDQDPSKGSGFATSFAICMACGCLPFGQSIGLTHVVHVTKKTLHGIKSGCQIRDLNAGPDDLSSGENLAIRDCLTTLPSATRKNYYRTSETIHGVPGQIYDNKLTVVSQWPEVVARIAFGGLVPMAALNLVQAVRFTAQGYEELSEKDRPLVFAMLREMVLRMHEKAPEIQLFGQYIEDMAQIGRKAKFTYFDPPNVNTRTATAMFARFMTLLERLTFFVKTIGKGKEKAVFDACCDELRRSYEYALIGHRSPGMPRQAVERRTVQEQISEILNSKSITTKICGQIARYIILTWTYYVTVVVWDANELQQCQTTFLQEADKSRIYYPYGADKSIQKLPDSFLLC
jgi:hypothetical protein